MTTSELVSATFLRATGKLPTFTSGTTKWDKIVAIANHNIKSWATEPGVDWNSLYIPNQVLGTVTATDTYALLPANIIKLSKRQGDFVRITRGTDQYSNYNIIEANSLKDFYWQQSKLSNAYRYCAQIGGNLVFSHTFTATDPEFGGTITVPAYAYPTEISGDSDVIRVDNPNWLVCMTAADYVMNDITRVSSYPTLVSQANDLMISMKDNNEAQVEMLNMPWIAPGGFGGYGFSNSAGQPLGDLE